MVPPGLHLDYGLDFRTRRVDDTAPTLTYPLLSSLVDNILQLEKPAIPGKPASFKAVEGPWGLGWAPPKPAVPGLSHDDGMASKMPTGKGEVPENKPHHQGESTEDQTLFKPDPEEVAEIVISGDNDSDLTIEVPQAASTPRSEPAQCRK